MPRMVKLQDVVREMALMSDERHAYLSRLTGELVVVSDEEFRIVEERDDIEAYPDWQQKKIYQAKEILETDEYLPLPGKLEVGEYRLMERFCNQIENPQLRNELLLQLKSLRALRNFNQAIYQYHLVDAWNQYRRSALEEVAIDWLKKNGIEYVSIAN